VCDEPVIATLEGCTGSSLLLAAPAALFGSYTYYVGDNLTSSSYSAPYWNMNGTGSETSTGLTSSLLLRRGIHIEDRRSRWKFELRSSRHAASAFFGRQLHALSGSDLQRAAGHTTSTGSFYAFDVENPVFASEGCSATVKLSKL
jgi:hypothetical protein